MYKVGIIGLGNIAAKYGQPDQPAPYCHVGGINHSDRVKLVAVADMSAEVREQFRTQWGGVFPDVKYYDTSTAMLDAEALDIVAICVRGPFHHQVLLEVLEAQPRAVFLEKPPSCSLVEMDEMVAAAKAKDIPVTVSYSRHWSPHVIRLSQLVRDGLIGKVESVVGYTGRAFLSFASHTTDLICQFAGYDATAVYARGDLRTGLEVPAGYEPEPSMHNMTIEFASGIQGVQLAANTQYTGFYVDVFGSEGYVRAGIYTPPVAMDKKWNMIDLAPHNMPPDASVFKVAYEQIAAHLDGGPKADCTDQQWVHVNEIGFAGIESVHRDERITLPNAHRTRRVHANG